ncbi:hypothetical protein IMY05_005G0166900 [Salix suchowensis]|nr:hypothetical protein IMY05_005G0166900 [Salix suchowensis]
MVVDDVWRELSDGEKVLQDHAITSRSGCFFHLCHFHVFPLTTLVSLFCIVPLDPIPIFDLFCSSKILRTCKLKISSKNMYPTLILQ